VAAVVEVSLITVFAPRVALAAAVEVPVETVLGLLLILPMEKMEHQILVVVLVAQMAVMGSRLTGLVLMAVQVS
jgi:hypothetical protein